jgi:hypothetical protein
VYAFQGLTLGWWKEERHSSDTSARSARFKSRPNGPPMDVVSSRKEKEEERVGGRRKYPGAPPHNIRKKERKKQADRKVPDRPGVMKRERLQKKKFFNFHKSKFDYFSKLT